jgi:hypothetical protein
MFRLTRRRLLAGVFGLALAAFLAVKLAPARSGPPIEIRAEGSDQGLARKLLADGLEKLFPKGNGRWRVVHAPAGEPGSRCIALSKAYRSSTGRAVSASYLFAGWLEVRLSDFVYADAAVAQRAFSAPVAGQAEACRGQVVAEGLRREGYVAGDPRVFRPTDVRIGDEGATSRVEIPTSYKGRRYNWDLDSTEVRRGRVILVVGTLAPEPFEAANQDLTRDLVSGGL